VGRVATMAKKTFLIIPNSFSSLYNSYEDTLLRELVLFLFEIEYQ